jgi:hypothetical protein
MHECNAQTLILPPFGPKRWDVTRVLRHDGSLRRYKAVVVCGAIYSARETRRVETTKRRWVADSGLRGD